MLTKDYVARMTIGTMDGCIPIVPRCSELTTSSRDDKVLSVRYEINCIGTTPYPSVLVVGGYTLTNEHNVSNVALTSRTTTRGTIMYLRLRGGKWQLDPLELIEILPVVLVSCSTLGILATDTSGTSYLLDLEGKVMKKIEKLTMPKLTNVLRDPIARIEEGYIVLNGRRYPNDGRNRKILSYDITSYSEGIINLVILSTTVLMGQENVSITQINWDNEEIVLPGYASTNSMVALNSREILLLNMHSCS